MLSEISQSQRDKCYVIPLARIIKLTEAENKLVAARVQSSLCSMRSSGGLLNNIAANS